MKGLVQFAFLLLLSISLSGCTEPYYTSSFHLQGNRSLVQSNYVFKLDGVMVNRIHSKKADGSSLEWTPYDISTWGGFLLTFTGHRPPPIIDSLTGSFEDTSGNLRPLNVVYRNENAALFILNTNVSVICPRLEYGKYKINVQYGHNDQTNTCNFEVSYVLKSERHRDIIWPWDIPMWWAYRNGGGP